MGHKRGGISQVYTHAVNDERLEQIVSAVHDWLFPQNEQAGDGAPDRAQPEDHLDDQRSKSCRESFGATGWRVCGE
jgi:hypothetical protein